MTLLKPGMKAAYKLPDGSTYEVGFAAVPVADPTTAVPLEPKQPDEPHESV